MHASLAPEIWNAPEIRFAHLEVAVVVRVIIIASPSDIFPTFTNPLYNVSKTAHPNNS
jgi:hypothetical protein